MNKLLKLTIVGLLSSASAFATGLNFQTLAPSAGDILQSGGTEIGLATSVRVGTLTGNVNFDDSTFTTFAEYDSAFTLTAGVGTSVLESTPNNVLATADAGNIASSLNLWMLVEDGAEQGVFYLGATPALNQLISTPALIAGAGDVAVGTIDGVNLRLVPEPSTYAALAGICALGAVALRRRRA